MKDNFKNIIFDLDGVLIDSFATMEIAFNYAFNMAVGVGIPPFEEYKKHTGLKLIEILEVMNLPSSMINLFVTESKRNIHKIRVYDGVINLLNHITKFNINLGIATGKDTKRAIEILEHLNLAPYFSLIVGSDAVEKSKPHGQMLKKHIQYYHSTPEQTLFIGDTIIDLKEGRNAGVKTAAALWGQGSEVELLSYRPDYVFYTPEEILSIL